MIVQIDGLAHPVLSQQINAGRVPVMSQVAARGQGQARRGSRCCRPRRAPARPASCTAETTTSPPSAGGRRPTRPSSSPTTPRTRRRSSSGSPSKGPGLLAEGRREHRQPDLRRRRAQLPDDVHDAQPEQGHGPKPVLLQLLHEPVRVRPRDRARHRPRWPRRCSRRGAHGWPGIEPRLLAPLPVPVPARADERGAAAARARAS